MIDPSEKLFLELFACDTVDAQEFVADQLLRFFPEVEQDDNYVYARGDIPVLMVAHTDTVHGKGPTQIYHDPARTTVWAPTGLGADDRAGVYGILKLLDCGFRPHVLFTDGEERGGVGAEKAGLCLPAPKVNLMIQIDRRGKDDAVYYSCDNKSLRKWVNHHGFTTAQGTFSDISVLMPAWEIAGVNLSAGYYNEHSNSEILNYAQLERTCQRVARMLAAPPRRKFAYKSYKNHYDLRSWRSSPVFRDNTLALNIDLSDLDRRDKDDAYEREWLQAWERYEKRDELDNRGSHH